MNVVEYRRLIRIPMMERKELARLRRESVRTLSGWLIWRECRHDVELITVARSILVDAYSEAKSPEVRDITHPWCTRCHGVGPLPIVGSPVYLSDIVHVTPMEMLTSVENALEAIESCRHDLKVAMLDTDDGPVPIEVCWVCGLGTERRI